jgi:hypothetical protein
MKIVSFGDSFVFGSEQKNNELGNLGWPGRVARRLGVRYQTLAQPGCGNQYIATRIFDYFGANDTKNTLVVINWTWAMRWDFYLLNAERWVTLGPLCVPSKLQDYVGISEAERLVQFYRDYTGVSDIWNKFRSLEPMYSVQNFLRQRGVTAIQTYMDPGLLVSEFDQDPLEHYQIHRAPGWPDVNTLEELTQLPQSIRDELDQTLGKIVTPPYIKTLQDLVTPDLRTFEGSTFLEWSRSQGFPVTPSPGDHPLEQAHEAAADLWENEYYQLLKNA